MSTNVHDLTQKEIAELLSVSARTVREWHAEGLPRLGTGNYDGAAVVSWHSAGDEAFADQRQRLAAAQAEKVEADNALRRREVADVAAVGAMMATANAAVRAKFLSMPSKLGALLVNITDANVIAGRIKTEIYAALAELADAEFELPPDVAGLAPSGNGSIPTAADADSKPMGGRKAPPIVRVKRGAGGMAN